VNIRFLAQRNAAALAIVVTALFPALTSWAADDAMLFTGGGYGPTPELAIQAAIGDGETSASAYQLYTCEVVGEPEVFLQNNIYRGNYYTAEATVSCTP
jgi:hypothetical protein